MCGQDSEPLGQMTQAGRERRRGRERGGREGEREGTGNKHDERGWGEWFNGAVFGAVIMYMYVYRKKMLKHTCTCTCTCIYTGGKQAVTLYM